MFSRFKTFVLVLFYLSASSADFHFFSLRKGLDEFNADTIAHKMRMVVRVQELLDNPQFFEALPEYSGLKNYKEEVIRLVMEHDSSKLYLDKNDPIIKVAAKMEGKDWRSMSEWRPLRKKAINAFSSLTDMDNLHESQSGIKIFSNDSKIRELAEDIVKMTDWDDVPKARGNEFGKGKGLKRVLTPTSEWVQKEWIRKDFTPERLERLVKLGKVLERPDFPYSKKVLFYTPERVKGKTFEYFAKPFFEARYPRRPFGLLKQEFMALNSSHGLLPKNAKAAPVVSKLSSFAGKALKAVPIIGLAATEGYDLAKKPDQNVVEGILRKVSFISDSQAPSCRAYTCHKFLADCKRKQNLKDMNWNICVDYFYSLSLAQQDELLRDTDLKKSLAESAPVITNLECPRSSKEKAVKIEFEHISAGAYALKKQSQWVFLRQDSSIERSEIVRTPLDPILEKVIYDSHNRPSLVQRCESQNQCENIQASVVENFGIRAPKSSRLISFITQQKSNVQKCCSESSCKNHFEQKSKGMANLASSTVNKAIK